MTASTERPEVHDLVWTALDHGLGSVEGGGPLTPFVIREEADVVSVHRFVAPTLEDGLDQARAFARRSGPATTCVAIVYDGYLTLDGVRRDAIFVQAQAAGATTSDLFAQQYESRDGTVVEIGNAKHVAINGPSLLSPSAPAPRRNAARPRGLARLLPH